MADEKLNITIEGAKDLFKNLEAQLSKIATAMDKVTKRTDAQTAATKRLRDEQKKSKKQKDKLRKAMFGLNVASKVSSGAIGGAASSLASLNPYTMVASKSIGILANLVKQVYDIFLGYNRKLLETGDLMGNLDLSTGDVTQAMDKLLSTSMAVQTSLWRGNMSLKEVLDTMKGFTTAGLMVTDLKDRLGGLKEATRIVTTYSKLFTMDTAEMATSVGMFVREMNLSAEATKGAFSEIYNASLNARYGTSNFLRIVNVAIPAIANFGGSIKEVSRFLGMMGKTGIISMKQAQETIGAILNGMKAMTWQQRVYAGALVNTDDMLGIMKNRYASMQKQIQAAGTDVKALAKLNYEADELRRDIAAAEQGDRLAMSRAMKRFGAAEIFEVTFKQVEKILGEQVKTLHRVATVTAKEQVLILELLQGQGVTQESFEIMKRLLHEGVEYEGKMLKTPEEFVAALRESDEFKKKVEGKFETDAQKAQKVRDKIEDKIKNTLEIIKNTFVNELMPIMNTLNEVLTTLNPKELAEGGKAGLSGIAAFAKGYTVGGVGGGLQAFISNAMNRGMQEAQAEEGAQRQPLPVPEGLSPAKTLTVPPELLAAGKEYKAYKEQLKAFRAKRATKTYWGDPGFSAKERKEHTSMTLEGPAKSAAFYKPIVEILRKAKAENSIVLMSREIRELVMSLKTFQLHAKGVTIKIQGGDLQQVQRTCEKVVRGQHQQLQRPN